MSLLDLNQYNEGTTIPSLRTETLNRLEFNIPSIQTQRKILDILNPLDDKIELNNQINKNLEQQAQAIFKSWFIEKDNNNRRICYVDEYFAVSIGKTPPRKEKQWFSMNNNDVKWASYGKLWSLYFENIRISNQSCY